MQPSDSISVARRSLLKGSVALVGLRPKPSLSQIPDRFVAHPSPSAKAVEVVRRGNVAIVLLQGNLMDEDAFADLLAAFDWVDKEGSIRSTALAGRGEHFSKGIVGSSELLDRLRSGRTNSEGSWRLSNKPLVAVVHGHTTGLGTALALCADVRVADANAILSWPYIGHADIFLERMTNEIGRANAQRFLLTGSGLNAHEAWRLGFIQHLAANVTEAFGEGVAIAETIARRREANSLA